MRKILKLSLCLSALVLLTACSNVKSTSLIGTYISEDGKVKMTVTSSGTFSFEEGIGKVDSDTTAEALVLENAGNSGTIQDGTIVRQDLRGVFSNWDLTADKVQTYEVKDNVTVTTITFSSGRPTGSSEEKVEISRKLEFVKEKDSIKCTVTVSGLKAPAKGKDGSIVFVK